MENWPQSASRTFRRRQLRRPKAWASIMAIVSRPRRLPAMLAVSTDDLNVATSADKAAADAGTRSLDDPRSTT
jgi:hypothetical protein